MKEILFLSHRIPYPPNKGDKIRSFHILKKLSQRYRVHVGTFVDHPDDGQYRDEVRRYADEAFFCPLSPRWAKLRSASGLIEGTALSIPYYRDRRMSGWVQDLRTRRRIDGVFVFSSMMAQYACDADTVVDFVDVDSEKWRSYAPQHRWPMSWVYRREGEHLLRFEREVAERCRRALFVSANEVALFKRLAPETTDKVFAMENGVDVGFFDPHVGYQNPFPPEIEPVVFTGAMDYWPNIDAVTWFAEVILPAVVRHRPKLRFYIVGSNPIARVVSLAADPYIEITGAVADVRPWLAHARLIVAPLRLARGVQNKVLEGMAMAKPLVVSPESMGGIAPGEHREVIVATSVGEWIDAVKHLDVLPPFAIANRRFIENRYAWEMNLQMLDALW
jgi:sugar transferase (PEP-CTERM/EpsH1 system associated)